MRFAYRLANPIMVSIAVLLATWTLLPLLSDGQVLVGAAWVVGISGIVGAAGAALRFPRALTLVLQLTGMLVVLWWQARNAISAMGAGPQGPLERIVFLAETGAREVRTGSIPLDATPSLVWLVMALVALITVATELLVNGLEQPAWSIAPLAVPYGIAAIALPFELDWPALAAVALGYGGIMLTATRFGLADRSADGRAGARFEASRLASAVPLVALATATSLLLAPLLPMGAKRPWLDAGLDAPIQLADPTIALNENLHRPQAQFVLRYTTSDGLPAYLRTVALTRLTTSGAQLEPMQLRIGNPPDESGAGRVDVTTRVQISMPSDYLPVPFAPRQYEAEGRWAFDPTTLAIVATGRNRTEQTADLTYQVLSAVPRPSSQEVRQAAAGTDPAGGETLKVPPGLSPEVSDLAASITASAGTAGEKALAIQSFLRSDAFSYSLQAPETTSMDAISSFLLSDRSGYCIHFAAAMVTLARIEGIPARMAVGFTPGAADGDGFVVTTHNMHTWPELYLRGLGWVPFEPTKSIATPPGWTNPDQTPTASPSPSPSPTSETTQATQAPPSVAPEPTTPATPPPSAEPPSPLVGWLILALVVLLLAAAPLLTRTAWSRWRLRGDQTAPELAISAWGEVHATFVDLDLEWDDHTPTLALATLGRQLPASGAALLESVAATVERTLYARGDSDVSGLPTQVRALRFDLLRAQPRKARAKALLLPASLLPRHWRR